MGESGFFENPVTEGLRFLQTVTQNIYAEVSAQLRTAFFILNLALGHQI